MLSATASSRPTGNGAAGAAAEDAGAGALVAATDPGEAGAESEPAGRAGARSTGAPSLPADASVSRHTLT